MKKLLICKMGNQLLEARVLEETESIKYSIVVGAPDIEERPNEIGRYELNTEGAIIVVYEPKPLTIEQKIALLEGSVMEIAETVYA